jgi:hypothetical protein
MRLFALFVGAVLMLGACKTATEEVDLEQEFADRCASRGYVSGTPEFKKCVEDERQIRLVRRSAGAVY